MATAIKTAVGPTILLQSGHYFDLLDPASSRFTVGDIAQGLANACRFAGQCFPFYSVAEHCVHASHIVPAEHAFAALMHDAAEAFIGDVTRPLKSLLPADKEIERSIEWTIHARFPRAAGSHDVVKAADLQMLAAEQAQLMPPHDDSWAILSGVVPAPLDLPCWSPRVARERWLLRFEQLAGFGTRSAVELERWSPRELAA